MLGPVLHVYVPAVVEAVSVIALPLQCVVAPVILTVGCAATVTVDVAVAVQPAPLSPVTV